MTGDSSRTDAELVAEALAGRERAFSALMRKHKDALYRFVRLYVGDASESYDLVQESFVSAWTNLRRYDAARPFPAWLKGIALNKCRDWARRRAVRRFFFAASDLDGAGRNAPSPALDPNEERNEERISQLEAAIADLPDALKAPLILTAIDGYSHKEAAALLGISAKAVELKVYRARQALKASLTISDDDMSQV